MAMTTARDLVTNALRTCGVIGSIATPDASQTNHALDELNEILNQWNNESLLPFKKDLVSFTTTAGQQDYTIGDSGSADVSAAPPVRILSVSLKIDSTTISKVDFISYTDFNEYARNTTTQSYQSVYTFNNTYPDPTLSVYPTGGGDTLQVVYNTEMSLADLNATLDFPAGYAGALQYELARILCITYGINNPLIIQEATKRKETLERNNIQANKLTNGRSGWYDIKGDITL
jgi:hypothetical protein